MRRLRTVSILALALTLPILAAAQPTAPRMIAEWEPVEGVMIRWPLGIPYDLVAEMSEDVTVHVIILSHQIGTATYQFENHGVNMTNVDWFVADSYSHWSRDWGPQALFDGDGDWGILDPWFDGYPWIPRGRGGRGWEQDDDTPAEFADHLGEPLWQPPFYLTGGNIMYDGHGRAFCSEAQVSENGHLSEIAFRAALETWCGVNDLRVLPNTEGYGIQHIDCVAKFLDEETVIVKELHPGHEDYPYVEENAAILSGLTSCYGNPYRVYRVYCGPFSGEGVGMTAYTNSLILGRKVLVPIFGCSGDVPALQAYADAMPGYEVLGYYGSWYYYDALHCRTMGIFDRGMLRVDVAPPPPEIPAAAHCVAALIDDRSEAGLVLAQCRLHWRLAGEPAFESLALVPTGVPDSYEAWIPPQPPGGEIEYYVSAEDLSGRRETRPVAAPEALFHTTVGDDLTTVGDPFASAPGLHAWPRPFTGILQLAAGAKGTNATVAVFDVAGRLVRRLDLPGGRGTWNGRDERGTPAPAGVYLLLSSHGGERARLKILKLR